ncbi:rRNA binding protein [Aureococcus anophagefferens]|nr:rRNA binding protein [Aureococcus anophagefferens]
MTTVKAVVRLRCPAGVAKAGPAIGQALGPHGLNMMEFVKAFNAATQKLEPDTPIPVVLTAYTNRTFSFRAGAADDDDDDDDDEREDDDDEEAR